MKKKAQKQWLLMFDFCFVSAAKLGGNIKSGPIFGHDNTATAEEKRNFITLSQTG